MEMDKRYNHQQGEQEARNLWEQKKVYAFTPDSRQVYSIDTPPPTVSGTLHIGHIFSYTHTDIIARYKRLRGFNVYYPMGFDDNGLPTERYVEKKHKTKAHLMKRSDFIDLCLKESTEIEKDFEALWRSMALSVDWTKIYSTISEKARKISQLSFIDLYNKNRVYRKMEPSLYCTTCQTSVAQAELDGVEMNTTFNNIVFTTAEGERLIVATTRPELLPACVAIFYHPDDKRYKHLNKKTATSPVFNKEVQILPDRLVDPEKGTGIVMCCTFGDQNDIMWYKNYNLSFIHIVGLDGKWTSGAGPLEGLRVHDARKKVLELLKEEGALDGQKAILHNVNTHERCKREIEYMVLPQWFVNILEHKKEFLELSDQINWKPAFMKARYKDWVSNLNWDWCISRQRFFGIPFPVWHCSDCDHVILADKKDLPVDPQEQAHPTGVCPECSSKELVPETDVMDTWNTSSLTPQINENWPEGNQDFSAPMSMRPQAHDIIRTWAFYTIVKAKYHNNDIPWKDIVISGHVLAGKEKISKSKGNEKMKPEVLLATYPADVIRFWSASGKLGTDTAFSENQLKIGQKLVTKMWNAFRFFAEHIQDVTSVPEQSPQDGLNQWMLDHLYKAQKHYMQQLDDYEYSHGLEAIDKFFWSIFCDNYLELVKDRFFNPDAYSEAVLQETKQVLYQAGLTLLKLYAPFIPHVTEILYQRLFKESEQIESLHLTQIDLIPDYDFADGMHRIEHARKVINQVRKLKSENHVSLRTEIKQLFICSEDALLLDKIKQEEQMIRGVTKAIEVIWSDEDLQTATLSGDEGSYKALVGLW